MSAVVDYTEGNILNFVFSEQAKQDITLLCKNYHDNPQAKIVIDALIKNRSL
ncbi:hypothetical protein [Brevibacillus sp. VP]|uniref:hypothetical protein n=1 Tax=unclassified Brevibacillus TaxID=2684853 RepID=UPI001374F706|nr:hypothetical protein [Brevibacillus sp. VP]